MYSSQNSHVIPQDDDISTQISTAHDANQASTNLSPHTRHHYESKLGKILSFHDRKGFNEATVYEGAKDQTISFSGVGSHHQNEIVERKHRELTQGAHTLLLHGIRIWPQMIDQMF